jgi:hypothetical protein
MSKGTIELSTGFMVMLILSIAIFSMGIYFVQRIYFSADKKVTQADEQAKFEMARLRNQGKAVALAPGTIEENGAVLLLITNDASVDSSMFGFKVVYDDCFNGPCGAASPDDWIDYSTKGREDDPIEIEPYESREFQIAVNPRGNSAGTYVFDVDVRWDSYQDTSIVYDEMRPDVDEQYSRLKFYVKI